MNENLFAKIVKSQIKKIALRELTSVIPKENNTNKRILSKLKNLQYSEHKMQETSSEYLNNKTINRQNAKQIFKYRTRMAKVGNNFKNSVIKLRSQKRISIKETYLAKKLRNISNCKGFNESNGRKGKNSQRK